MDKQICNRCHAKEAIFICLMCDSFKTLCSKCDSYIHNLPSKRIHKREPLNDSSISDRQNIPKSVSMTVLPNTGGEWKVDMTITPNRTEPSEGQQTIKSSFNPGLTSSTLAVISNGTYTKEYVNEIKVFYYLL
jgi:hypothetical protein